MAYVNEPMRGGPGCNLSIEDGSGAWDQLYVALGDIAEGQELYIDYGLMYDRSSYGVAQSQADDGLLRPQQDVHERRE